MLPSFSLQPPPSTFCSLSYLSQVISLPWCPGLPHECFLHLGSELSSYGCSVTTQGSRCEGPHSAPGFPGRELLRQGTRGGAQKGKEDPDCFHKLCLCTPLHHHIFCNLIDYLESTPEAQHQEEDSGEGGGGVVWPNSPRPPGSLVLSPWKPYEVTGIIKRGSKKCFSLSQREHPGGSRCFCVGLRRRAGSVKGENGPHPRGGLTT